MSGPKPLTVDGLHYPSQTAAVRALYARGLGPAQIAARTGLSDSAVNNAIWSGPSARKALSVPRRVITALEPAAARRNISATVLACRLLAILAAEPALTENLLDDADSEAAA